MKTSFLWLWLGLGLTAGLLSGLSFWSPYEKEASVQYASVPQTTAQADLVYSPAAPEEVWFTQADLVYSPATPGEVWFTGHYVDPPFMIGGHVIPGGFWPIENVDSPACLLCKGKVVVEEGILLWHNDRKEVSPEAGRWCPFNPNRPSEEYEKLLERYGK